MPVSSGTMPSQPHQPTVPGAASASSNSPGRMGRVRGLGHRRRSRFSGCGCGYDWTSAGIDVLVGTPIHRRDGNAVARFGGLGDQGFDLTQAHGLTAELRRQVHHHQKLQATRIER